MSNFNRKVIIFTSLAILIFFASSFLFKESQAPSIKEKKGNEIIRNEKDQLEEGQNQEFKGDENEIINLVNESRHQYGLPALSPNEKLSRSAMAKARDMEENQYFEHVSPNGLQPWFFAEKESYVYKNFGENLAEGFFSAKSMHESWMESSGHRDNILSEEFEEIGVAVLNFEQNGLKSFLVVQHFGTQLEPKNSLTITCPSKIENHCKDAKLKESEIKNALEEQESFIKKIKNATIENYALEELQKNIKRLKEIKNDLNEYLNKCENLIDNCEKWE